ncbi:hypothetical protein [Streptomyces sp. 2132.2]|uniref:hypothetical protein n=1 Tax=Streptomyces sp. 2132.2 TaxID=2485161 RepID=UPI0021A54B8C|nr:hypothetical protein [Streptomyces sp. 2132.2]
MTRALVDEHAYAVVRALLGRKDPGPRLFAYWEGRAWHEVRAEELNAYLRERAGRAMTAKDFRTWHAAVLAAVARGCRTARRAPPAPGTGPSSPAPCAT